MVLRLVVLAALLSLSLLQAGQAQTPPDPRRQLNQDIQNQQRQIQERSREIEQRALEQQREEERRKRELEDRRYRQELLEQQRQSGQPIIIIEPNRQRPSYDNRPYPPNQPDPIWAEPIIPGWDRQRIILRGQYWVQPGPSCQLETWMDGRGQPYRRWVCP
jgi:hypothetical protein